MRTAFRATAANALDPMVVFGAAEAAQTAVPVMADPTHYSAAAAFAAALDDDPFMLLIPRFATARAGATHPSMPEQAKPVHITRRDYATLWNLTLTYY